MYVIRHAEVNALHVSFAYRQAVEHPCDSRHIGLCNVRNLASSNILSQVTIHPRCSFRSESGQLEAQGHVRQADQTLDKVPCNLQEHACC